MAKKRSYTNNSVKKAISVLEFFNEQTEALSMKEIADRLGLSTGTIYPIVATLEEHGYLRKDAENKKYSLGMVFLGKSSLVVRGLDIRDKSGPHLKELLNRCKENVHLAVLDHKQIVYIDRKEGVQSLMIRAYIGKRAPAHCTALGKVLLAGLNKDELEQTLNEIELTEHTKNTITNSDALKAALNKVRSQGFALENEEYQLGGMCIAAPIINHQGRIVAGLSVSVPKSRITAQRKKYLIEQVTQTSKDISKSLGWQYSSKDTAIKIG